MWDRSGEGAREGSGDWVEYLRRAEIPQGIPWTDAREGVRIDWEEDATKMAQSGKPA